MNDTSDETLLLKFRNGDADAFSELYARHKDALFRYFLRQSQHADTAAELAQDVWTSIIYSVETYADMAKFTTYLYRIARNRFIDHQRRQKVRPLNPGNDPDDSETIAEAENNQPEQILEQQQQTAHIKRLVAELPEQQRDVFLLKEESGLALSEISEVCHCNPETTKSRLRYAYAKLREGMKHLAENHDVTFIRRNNKRITDNKRDNEC